MPTLMVVELEAKHWKLRQYEKFHPSNFTPLKHYHQLQSERLGRLVLYLSTMLNRMVTSVCFPDWWLWSYRRNAENSASMKNSAQQTSPPSCSSLLQSEKSWEVLPGRIWWAESSGGLHFIPASLVVAAHAETFPIFRFSEFRHQTSPPSITTTPYSQDALEGCFFTFRTRWIEW